MPTGLADWLSDQLDPGLQPGVFRKIILGDGHIAVDEFKRENLAGFADPIRKEQARITPASPQIQHDVARFRANGDAAPLKLVLLQKEEAKHAGRMPDIGDVA